MIEELNSPAKLFDFDTMSHFIKFTVEPTFELYTPYKGPTGSWRKTILFQTFMLVHFNSKI